MPGTLSGRSGKGPGHERRKLVWRPPAQRSRLHKLVTECSSCRQPFHEGRIAEMTSYSTQVPMNLRLMQNSAELTTKTN
jgi:hypothetical protein